ncbi:hypothetical protein [Conyzicola sp.]|uniref:hypothetical protein n=1 Tax=Conyzicola sp. TaxID=1969404 RepID=UPI0039899F6C
MADESAFASRPAVHRPLTWRFALAVVAGSFVGAAAVRWTIVLVASAQARNEVSGLQTILLGAALGLVIGYMVAVIIVGVGMRNREHGGRFTVVFAIVLLAVHVFSGMSRGMAILAVPLVTTSSDFSWLFLVPPLFTVPAAAMRVIRWRWAVGVAGVGVALAAVLGAMFG